LEKAEEYYNKAGEADSTDANIFFNVGQFFEGEKNKLYFFFFK